MFKVIIVLFSLKKGGAAIAANKFKQLLSDNASRFNVDSISQDNVSDYYFQFFKRIISYALAQLQFDGNPIKHSLNFFSYVPIVTSFKVQSQSIHHLHWINNDTLSVFDFDKIPSGTVITLHDEWLYCGAEHYYKVLDNSNDFENGYRFFKKGVYGIHWNYLVWKIKYKKLAHRNDLIYTVPSNWMLERAKLSAILRKSDIRLLPNPIDTEVFKPATEEARSLRSNLNIDEENFVFVFGAVGGKKNKLKGVEYLEQALEKLRSAISVELTSNIVLIDFGGTKVEGCLHGFRSISMGHIKEPDYLAQLYSMAGCVIVPSMVESFGQVAAEALSCSTPVVCFDTSGLRDIVLHDKTGLVAHAFDVESLMGQLLAMIEMPKDERLKMGQQGRKHVLQNFSYSVISEQYLKILEDAVEVKT